MLPVCNMNTYKLTRLLCLLLAGSALRLTWKVEIPKTVSAVQGTCVIVPCHTSPHSRATWYRYHSLQWPKVYDGRDPGAVVEQFRGQTSVSGSPREGDCSLRIEAVRLADDGVRLYTWINPDESSSQRFYEQTVTLKVTGMKALPQISVQDQIAEGSALFLNCTIRHSCPISPRPSFGRGCLKATPPVRARRRTSRRACGCQGPRRKAARSTLGSPRVQTDPASDSKRFVNKVSLEPSTTYSNWPNIPLTHRTQGPRAGCQHPLPRGRWSPIRPKRNPRRFLSFSQGRLPG
ncbi:hypothetical protein SKAU_G00417690 [Synaphobranchus kaupii]|uniref:Immunoglobulin V-set domain-containing protein n=1 Tax=Synaphobranchus kaupii TaxID=118154 RepID=A0A9Q1E612_SYNKA|nr:hypothetical protein SKAU_G00417690 [Synaphobranchus kaupii]